MSQIPRSQFALKKRQNASPMVTIPSAEIENGAKGKKSNGNGHKYGTFDNDVVIIEDEIIHFGHEEVVASTVTADDITPAVVEVPSPGKKKRSRKSKDSTESKDSEVSKKVEEKTAVEVLVEIEAPAPVPEKKEYKIVHMSSSESLASLKRRSDRLQNASTIVNLSTVSSTDQSTKTLSDETLDASQAIGERRVSGRRSTRPIEDIKFSYRTPNPDDSLNGTTDATIGSEINNDSMLTTPGVDRKRALSDSMEAIDSPKRSRMDLSGLFSSFSSPVTLLRNRFKRTNLASTPFVGKEAPVKTLDESDDQLKEIDLNAPEELAAPLENDIEEELKVITTPVKKSSCSIM